MARADKDDTFREYRKAALEQGWEVVELQTRWKFTPPDKKAKPVFYSTTVGEWRSIQNFKAEMRRSGFILPKRLRKGG